MVYLYLILFNNFISNCAIGIASKDYSKPLIINNVIIENIVGISGYQKKKIFGGSDSKIVNSIIWNNDKQLVNY